MADCAPPFRRAPRRPPSCGGSAARTQQSRACPQGAQGPFPRPFTLYGAAREATTGLEIEERRKNGASGAQWGHRGVGSELPGVRAKNGGAAGVQRHHGVPLIHDAQCVRVARAPLPALPRSSARPKRTFCTPSAHCSPQAQGRKVPGDRDEVPAAGQGDEANGVDGVLGASLFTARAADHAPLSFGGSSPPPPSGDGSLHASALSLSPQRRPALPRR